MPEKLLESFSRHRKPLLLAAKRILRNHQEAEDVVQDAFLRLWRASDLLDFSHDIGPLLFVATRRLAIDRRRRLALRVTTDFRPELALARAGQESAFVVSEIMDILVRLPGRQRQAFLLHHLWGLSLHEISRVQGVSKEAVKSRIGRAVRQIRASGYLRPGARRGG